MSAMHEDLINQIANLKQRIERELSFSHLDMVHNVLPILKNMELVLAKGDAVNFDNLVEDAEKTGAKPYIDAVRGSIGAFLINIDELKALITQYILADRAASGEAILHQRKSVHGWVNVDWWDIEFYKDKGQKIRSLFTHAQPTPAQIETYALNIAEKVRLACYKSGAENIAMTDLVKIVEGEPL